jgi:hypothetical protein
MRRGTDLRTSLPAGTASSLPAPAWNRILLTCIPVQVEYVRLENPVENFRNIIGWLVKHDWSDGDIVKVVAGNGQRDAGAAEGLVALTHCLCPPVPLPRPWGAGPVSPGKPAERGDEVQRQSRLG